MSFKTHDKLNRQTELERLIPAHLDMIGVNALKIRELKKTERALMIEYFKLESEHGALVGEPVDNTELISDLEAQNKNGGYP